MEAPRAAEASNVECIGYHDLNGRPAFKLAMQVVADRWYLYLSSFWHNGWSVLDVTDPRNPELVNFIEGPANTSTWQVQVADGRMVGSLEYKNPDWGGDPSKPNDEGILIYDVSKPPAAELLGHWKSGSTGTHRNHYDGGRYAHLASGAPGFKGNIYRIVDISDPRKPFEAGRWFMAEQYVAGGHDHPRPTFSVHGPPYADGDRCYVPYMAGGMIILDISDVATPRLVSRLDMGPALASHLTVHTVIPLQRRGLAIINSEAIAEDCDEPVGYAAVVDISNEKKPRVISLFPAPAPVPGLPYRNYKEKRGRYGPHNQHHWQKQDCLLNRDDLVFLTYFNAGLRIYDISDPYVPREIAFYVPENPTERRGLLPKTLVTQTEDVLVDVRGNIYVTDKNHGVHILRTSVL